MPAQTQNARDASKPLIYLVDDEPMLLDLASAILEPVGFRTARFRSGEAALKAYQNEPEKPALLITDYAMGMGVMTGLDLIAACRKMVPDQKTMLLSGTVDASVSKNASVKPNSFLAKPYQPPQLVKMVRSLTRT